MEWAGCFGTPIDDIRTLRADNEHLAAACQVLERKLNDARTKVSELAVKLGEARRERDETIQWAWRYQ